MLEDTKLKRTHEGRTFDLKDKYTVIQQGAIAVIWYAPTTIVKNVSNVIFDTYLKIGVLLYEFKPQSKCEKAVLKQLSVDLKECYSQIDISP